MLESTRLDYLAAMGVVNWVPRQPLANAAYRLPALLPDVVSEPQQPPRSAAVAVPATTPATRVQGVEAVRARLKAGPEKPLVRAGTAELQSEPEVPAVEPMVQAPPLESFYLQLWMAGPCALLLETPEPGLESASPGLRLLKDILRAAQLPAVPHLYADFRWPLTRNRQFDRSAPAASLALQAFMRGRLENEPVVSIACFGTYPRLLLGPDLEPLDRPMATEQPLDGLPAAWFAPDLESLMNEPASKAQLWQQLKRIMPRWQAGS